MRGHRVFTVIVASVVVLLVGAGGVVLARQHSAHARAASAWFGERAVAVVFIPDPYLLDASQARALDFRWLTVIDANRSSIPVGLHADPPPCES